MSAHQSLERADTLSRRTILGMAALAAMPLVTRAAAAPPTGANVDVSGIKALTFDVQGTLVDYYQPFLRVGTALDARKGVKLDWAELLRDWNGAIGSLIQAISAGTHPWIPAGKLFRESLDTLLVARGLSETFDDADRRELMSFLGQMAPWPDSVAGITRLKRRFTVATLSNVGMATVIALAKRTGMPFDAVLTGELVHAYKPAPVVYESASTYLGFAPGEIMMVAAHKIDLKAAKAAGFKTAYIPRPMEIGPATKIDRSPEPFIDITADGIVQLSSMLLGDRSHKVERHVDR